MFRHAGQRPGLTLLVLRAALFWWSCAPGALSAGEAGFVTPAASAVSVPSAAGPAYEQSALPAPPGFSAAAEPTAAEGAAAGEVAATDSETLPAIDRVPGDTVPPRVSRANPAIWLVSTRRAAGSDDNCPWQVCRRDGEAWTAVALDELACRFAAGTVCWGYIHGNNNTAEDAAEHGLWVYERLVEASPGGRPEDFLIWSWPSQREPVGFRQNVRLKADVAEQQAPHLARFIDRFCPHTRLGLVGHSYGARLATAALHLAGGGSLPEVPTCPAAVARPGCLRLALTGAAMDYDWLVPGRRHGRAPATAAQILVVTNPSDAVLRLYPRLYGQGGPPALGAVGSAVAPVQFGMAHRLLEWNVSSAVGTGHLSRRYLGTPAVAAGIAGFLAGRPPAAPGIAPETSRPGTGTWHLSQQPATVTR